VEADLAGGRSVILEIDWQGARQVRASLPQCATIFILPPSRDALEKRLRARRTESDAAIERRLRDAVGICRIGRNLITSSSTTTLKGRSRT